MRRHGRDLHLQAVTGAQQIAHLGGERRARRGVGRAALNEGDDPLLAAVVMNGEYRDVSGPQGGRFLFGRPLQVLPRRCGR